MWKAVISYKSVYVTCSYIPPPSTEFPEYLNHLSAIQSVSNRWSDRGPLVVLGDLNIPGLMWSPEEKSNIPFPYIHDFPDGLFDLSLSQVNYIRSYIRRFFSMSWNNSWKYVSSRVASLTQLQDSYYPTFKENNRQFLLAQDTRQFFNFVSTKRKTISLPLVFVCCFLIILRKHRIRQKPIHLPSFFKYHILSYLIPSSYTLTRYQSRI